jgi:hypothetical protein
MMTWKIHHPYTDEITLDRIEYKIYADGTPIIEKVSEFKEKTIRAETILPGKITTLTFGPIVDLSKIDEEEKNRIVANTAKWSITGVAYFHSSAGTLSAPIIGIKPEYPSDTSRITIEVRDEAWNPVGGTKITFVYEFGHFSKFATESGLAEFEVPATKYTVIASKEGYEPYQESLDLSTPSVGGKVIQLTKSAVPEVTKPAKPEVPAAMPWWRRYWFIIAGVVIIGIIVPIILKLKKKPTVSSQGD